MDKYLCDEYRMVLDAACDQLQGRFDQDGTGEHERMKRLLLPDPDVQTVKTLLENSLRLLTYNRPIWLLGFKCCVVVRGRRIWPTRLTLPPAWSVPPS